MPESLLRADRPSRRPERPRPGGDRTLGKGDRARAKRRQLKRLHRAQVSPTTPERASADRRPTAPSLLVLCCADVAGRGKNRSPSDCRDLRVGIASKRKTPLAKPPEAQRKSIDPRHFPIRVTDVGREKQMDPSKEFFFFFFLNPFCGHAGVGKDTPQRRQGGCYLGTRRRPVASAQSLQRDLPGMFSEASRSALAASRQRPAIQKEGMNTKPHHARLFHFLPPRPPLLCVS